MALTLLLVGLAVGAIAGAAPGAAATTAAKPKWQYLPSLGTKQGADTFYTPVGWAADRVWIASTNPSLRLRLASFRVSGKKLTSAVMNAPIPAAQGAVITGSDLAYHPLDEFSRSLPPVTRTLLPSGRLGEPQPVPDDLESAKPKNAEEGIGILAGAQIGQRRVWALRGAISETTGFFSVCCTESDAGRVITQGRGSTLRIARLGVDARQRLWLAWIEHRAGGGVRLLELDPATLAPKTRKPIVVPRTSGSTVGPSSELELACAAVCRVVRHDRDGIFTWAPGERSLTWIARSRPREGRHPQLVGADYRGRSLVVVYRRADLRQFHFEPQQIDVARGNARGARLRRVASLRVDRALWRGFVITDYSYIRPVFTPGGVVVFQTWAKDDGTFENKRVTSAFVPLRG